MVGKTMLWIRCHALCLALIPFWAPEEGQADLQ